MNKFEQLGLNESLLKAILDLGFENPSEVQEKAIPLLLEKDTDMVALAQTGTGKTAAFGFPLIQKIDADNRNTQALVLSPTRELCLQITNELKNYSKYEKGINVVAVYGGASITEQARDIKRGAQIIVATPGRMQDMINRGLVNIKSVDVVSILPNQVGYIKVNRFAESTYTEFKKGLDELASKKVKAVVVDLRDNPGGYLNEAIKMTDEFLPEGKLIVYTKDRKNKVVKTYATESGDFEKTKVYVLINESSASASEIFAGAIQDNDRGTVIGRRSFGKGLVQKEMPMGDGSSVRLTVSRYYTPTGRSIQKSYKNGTEEYYTDFYKRFYNGELKNKDSIKVNDTLKFKTPAGRIVYGGGGIMPDIFVPIAQGQQNESLYFTSQMGITAHFVFEYLDKTRASFQKLTPEQFVSANLNSDALYLDFVKYTINNGIQVDYGDVKKAFMKELIAEFIKQLYGEKAYYQFVLIEDPMIRKVLDFEN